MTPAEAAVWSREWDRRIRSNHVCVLCGLSREFCDCPDQRENSAPSSESEAAPE
jgi:hypothetical protein